MMGWNGNSRKRMKEDVMGKPRKVMGLFLVCMFSVLLFTGKQTIYADHAEIFTGEVNILKEEDSNYVLQVKVGNEGADFAGTVRLLFSDSDNATAFDMDMSLPRQGEKQYTMTVPESNITQTRGKGSLLFLNEDGKVLQKIQLKDLLKGKKTGFTIGVLSDSYDDLTYLDMGGQSYYLQNMESPINLLEMQPDTIADNLDGLYYLVIDSFDVTTLDAKTIEAIEKWVRDGGWLILGTGSYVEKTLGAFDKDFTGITYGEISEKGTVNEASIAAANMGNYYIFTDCGIDLTQLAIAELNSSGIGVYASSIFPGWICTQGQGSIAVLSFSLSEEEMQKASFELVTGIYDETAYNANSISQYNGTDWEYQGENAFSVIDNENTNLDFSWLKGMILIYVILVGPILYLILKKIKKSEGYWIAVPVLGILFIGMVFLFGQNLRVNTTKVYAVTAQKADGKESGKVKTYYNAYHSGVKPWNIELTDNYEYAGAAFMQYSYSATSGKDYHYRVGYGEGLEAGISPTSNFENAYFLAGGESAGAGEIVIENLEITSVVQKGSVTNKTAYDFPYLMLTSSDYVMMVSDVKAGETVDIAQARKDNRVVYEMSQSYPADIFYDLVDLYGRSSNSIEDRDLKAALYIGMCMAMQQDGLESGQIMAAGIVPDYQKTVESKCMETSYGCLYTIAEQEVTDVTD